MKIFAYYYYTGEKVPTCYVELKDSKLFISINSGFDNDSSVILDINKIKTNRRYEILSIYCSKEKIKLYTNFDSNSNIIQPDSLFFEQYYFKSMLNALPARINILYTTKDELFIVVRGLKCVSQTIDFIENQDEPPQMETIIAGQTEDDSAVSEYLKDFHSLTSYMELLSKMVTRSSVAYLDAQDDLLLKLVSILVENASDDMKKKLNAAVSNYSELLSKFNQYNILDTKTEEQILNTVKRKENVRAAQKSYYDSIKES